MKTCESRWDPQEITQLSPVHIANLIRIMNYINSYCFNYFDSLGYPFYVLIYKSFKKGIDKNVKFYRIT